MSGVYGLAEPITSCVAADPDASSSGAFPFEGSLVVLSLAFLSVSVASFFGLKHPVGQLGSGCGTATPERINIISC